MGVSLREVGRGGCGCGTGSVLLLDYDFLATIVVLGTLERVVVGVVVSRAVDGMSDMIGDLVSCLGDTVTERVVVAVVVVISHITLVLLGGVNRGTSSLYSNLFPGRVAAVDGVNVSTGRVGVVLGSEGLLAVTGGLLEVGLGVEAVAFGSVSTDDGTGTFTELTLGDVDLGSTVVLFGTLDCVEVAVVGPGVGFKVCPDLRALGWVAVSGVAVLVGVDVNLYAFAATGLLRLSVAMLLVNVNLFAVLLGAALAVFENSDVLSVGVEALSRSLGRLFDVDREGFLTFRVTFPSCLW